MLCPTCLLPHEPETPCGDAQRKAMKTLLVNIGTPGTCRGCSAAIHWVTHKNGKKTPYNSSGLNHFVSCPERERFKK